MRLIASGSMEQGHQTAEIAGLDFKFSNESGLLVPSMAEAQSIEPQDVDDPVVPWLENELSPGNLAGSVSYMPAEAFGVSGYIRSFLWRYKTEIEGSDPPEFSPFTERFQEAIGWAEFSDSGPDAGKIVRHLPLVDYNNGSLVANRIDFRAAGYRGIDDPIFDEDEAPMRSGNKYEFIFANVHFNTPRFDIGPRDPDDPTIGIIAADAIESSRWCTKEVRPGVSWIQARPGALKWKHDNTEIQFNIPTMLAYEDLIVHWYAVPFNAVPILEIKAQLGRINTNDVKLPRYPDNQTLYKANQLLFHSYMLYDDFFPDSRGSLEPSRCCHLAYVFKYRKNLFGWNGYPYPRDGTFKEIVRASGSSIYQDDDFDFLFLPP